MSHQFFFGSSSHNFDRLVFIKSMQQYVKILEVVNIGITILFLIAYVYRLIHLRHFAITDRHKSKYSCTRVVLCVVYIILSIPFLIICLDIGLTVQGQDQLWMIQVGVGQFIDAVILLMQLIVLRLELSKERPYSPFHLMFSIYLTVISIIRLVFAFLEIKYGSTYSYVSLGFYFAFLLNSVLLLGYWIAKRQQLPEFQKNNYFNFDELNNLDRTRNIMHRNIEISFMRKTSENFNYVRPTVSVQKNQFRIILQIQQSEGVQIQDKDSVVDHRDSVQTKKARTAKKTKIISDHFYSINQVLELYKICGRFNIKQKLNFNDLQLGKFYKSLQSFLDELFSNKMNYLNFMLKFFDVPEQYSDKFDKILRDTLKQSEFDIYANMDKNASIISINIFKQLWMDDYYLFYMDVVAVDGKFQSRPMRRYNDFQMFHSQLSTIIKKKYAGKYYLPGLPKKYLFNWDQSKITQRRNELQAYLRNLTNDYKLMLELQEVRQATLQFLGQFQSVALNPINQVFQNFYKNIQIFKGEITKQFSNSQYVTFYEFKIMCNGLPIRTLKKRFNDFVLLHQSIQRWMTNTMINYKFLVLPEKHIYKSNNERQQKLKAYLESLIKVQDVWKVYQVNSFFKAGQNGMKDISFSRINSPEEQNRIKYPPFSLSDSNQVATQRFIDEDSFESKGRMSALIEELGNN